MKRAIILMMDSFGIGGAEDAARFGDQGADTLGHIACWFAREKAKDPSRHLLHLPNLAKLGLGLASRMSTGHVLTPSIGSSGPLKGAYSYAREVSSGKDTLSGHWELTGVPVMFDWGYFPDKPHCFPKDIIQGLIKEGNLPGVLGEKHASGTVIIQELGEEHMKTGKPIVYTSADSVLQIAAHERTFGLERLYQLCEIAYRLVQPYHIARVIARPFVGEKAGAFTRTGNRHDYAVPAPEPTLLDAVYEKAGGVYAVGKIADIFAHRGITKAWHATGLDALFDATLEAMDEAGDRSLVFTNFVDFDSTYGHRRDVEGYGEGLMLIDRRLPELMAKLQPGDLVLVTADHGCDPTWKGTDHTREHVPMLFFGPEVKPGALQPMGSYSAAGQILAHHLGLSLKRGMVQKVIL
ncbi:MAG: phosphopentomutase [Acidaminococcus sp.]|uniref:phosphopentomutase n=1 Tax=Acidaminococcus sp. TaxID=1872103 RepID=UPI0026E05EE0|nr:phosphopentomutase [Acidaminococcus sp.]MDO5597817.1 phosphopentomutase [Acidaminococcus sp.]